MPSKRGRVKPRGHVENVEPSYPEPRRDLQLVLPEQTAVSVPTELTSSQTELALALKEAGVTKQKLVEGILAITQATERKRAGSGRYEDVPDYEVQARGWADMKALMQLAGELPSKAEETGTRATLTMIRIEPDGSRTVIEARG